MNTRVGYNLFLIYFANDGDYTKCYKKKLILYTTITSLIEENRLCSKKCLTRKYKNKLEVVHI